MCRTVTCSLILTIYLCIVCSQRTDRFFRVRNSTLSSAYGRNVEEYKVITDDGYILGLFRLSGQRGPPFLLMHGIFDSSDTWLARGNNSLATTLAKFGFDVWLGNCRGNIYSRNHVYLNADKHPQEYWDFSFHENGYYDLPAIIDVVLEETGEKKLNAIGHSQGNAIFYVMGSLRPEYNDKVNVLVALAPIAFLSHIPAPLSLIVEASPRLLAFARSARLYYLFGDSTSGKLYKSICSIPIVGYILCAFGFVFPICGVDLNEYDYNFHYKYMHSFPRSVSLKNLKHFAQVSRSGTFSQFDYGSGRNLGVYGSEVAPEYNLGRVTMPVALLCGENDKLATVRDSGTLRHALPNVVQYTLLQYKDMNHIDFVWGKHMEQYLFPTMFKILNRYIN